MVRKKVKAASAALVASMILAAASGLSYGAVSGSPQSSYCWGACQGTAASREASVAANKASQPSSPSVASSEAGYQGTWGFELGRGHEFTPRHQTELASYGASWGADWPAELPSRGYTASHAKPASRAN